MLTMFITQMNFDENNVFVFTLQISSAAVNFNVNLVTRIFVIKNFPTHSVNKLLIYMFGFMLSNIFVFIFYAAFIL